MFPPWGPYSRAAVVHDWLYWNQDTTRKEADDILQEAMAVCGCSEATIDSFNKALDLFGQRAWDSDRAEKLAGKHPFRTFTNDSTH